MSTATQPTLDFNFKNGDQVFFEFEEGIIDNIDEHDGVAEFKLPYGTMGFNYRYEGNRVFPVSTVGQFIAKTVKQVYDDLRTSAEGLNLNWPGIKDYTTLLFNKAMTKLQEGDEVGSVMVLNEVVEFHLAVKRQMEHARGMSAFGVPVFPQSRR